MRPLFNPVAPPTAFLEHHFCLLKMAGYPFPRFPPKDCILLTHQSFFTVAKRFSRLVLELMVTY